jgi:ABC-type maltose transport system permease subunit
LIAAAIVITASPLVLLYLFTQRYIIAGMTSGALKG